MTNQTAGKTVFDVAVDVVDELGNPDLMAGVRQLRDYQKLQVSRATAVLQEITSFPEMPEKDDGIPNTGDTLKNDGTFSGTFSKSSFGSEHPCGLAARVRFRSRPILKIHCFAPFASARARDPTMATSSAASCVFQPPRCRSLMLHSAVIHSGSSFRQGM